MSPCCAHRMHALFWNPKIRARTHPDPPGCSNFTFVNKLQTTHKKMHMMCVQINAAGRNHWKFNKRRAIMIYVARQNLISPVHVDLNCGKTVSRAPPDRIFFPFAISSRGLLTVRCHREHKKLETFNSAGYIKHRR